MAMWGISVRRVQSSNRRWILCLWAGVLALGFDLTAQAAPGDLDPSFDADGKVQTHFDGFEQASAVVAQPDGILVAAGTAPTASSGRARFALARYRPDGLLDRGFGRKGLVRTSFGTQPAAAVALAIQTDGKLVAAGALADDSLSLDFAVVRYNPDGSLDPSFGLGGRVVTDLGSSDLLTALAVQPDGRIVAAGHSVVSALVRDFALVRYNPDGSLDPSFGSGGRVLTHGAFPNALALQPDGKIVVAGVVGPPSGGGVALIRYNPDGSLDPSFGSGGRVLTDFAKFDGARSLVLQADGKLVAAGFSSPRSVGPPQFALQRYNVDGSPDLTFGTAGEAFSSFRGFVSGAALALQADGKLVAAGVVADFDLVAGVQDTDFALARFLVTDAQPPFPPRCGGKQATILGTEGSDTIRGTWARDVILGGGGNDTIRGLAGNDIICGGRGNDTLLGGRGGDRLLGESGGDRLFGDEGRNILSGGRGRDSCQPNGGSKGCETGDGTRPPDPRPPACPLSLPGIPLLGCGF